jgi:predicted enzyme related to lactoylglutathione lyase
MSEQDRYIAGVPCWIDVMHPDPAAAAEFYAGLFGWEVEEVTPPGAPGSYRMGRLGGGDVAGIGSQPPDATPASAWNTYVWVEDADATAEKVRAAGGAVLMEPGDVGDAGRTAVFADPAGAVFFAWQPRRHRGATVVNEAGSLNFNTLSTRDLDGAGAFYSAVFGWELLDLGAGAAWWALPAYGDFLEDRSPGLRERIAGMGAPPRFEEVVAAVMPIPDDQPDTPAHWSVTFAVEDADATVARAGELGGRVVVAPFDAPWVRSAVIADPQGATFIASQFKPENKDLPAGAGAAAA